MKIIYLCTADKRQKCSECGREISVGEQYLVIAGNGINNTKKLCEECRIPYKLSEEIEEANIAEKNKVNTLEEFFAKEKENEPLFVDKR